MWHLSLVLTGVAHARSQRHLISGLMRETLAHPAAHLKLDEAQQLGDLHGAHAEDALDSSSIVTLWKSCDAVRRAQEDLRQRSEDRQGPRDRV